MADKSAAQDYAQILKSADLSKEINPLIDHIDDMLMSRLEEFETLLANVRAESNGIMGNHVSNIISFSDDFAELRTRIDNLEEFVGVVNANLNEVERSVDVAEQELSVTDYSLRGLLLKPLKAKLSPTDASDQTPKSNLSAEGDFQPVPIFKSDNYFGPAKDNFETSS